MDNYEILGVSRDASREEIKAAYEESIRKIDGEVMNEKNAKAFKKVIKDAYDGLTVHNSNEDTLVMTKEEFEELAKKEEAFDYAEEDYYEDEYDDYDSEGYSYDYDDYDKEFSKGKRRSNKYDKRRNRSRSKEDRERNYRRDRDDNKEGFEYHEKYHHNAGIPLFIKLPLTIIIIPFIIVFTAILFVFDIINAVLWAVTKILIITSIAAGIGYGYLLYKNMVPFDNRIPIVCGSVFIASIVLPMIARIIPKPLEILNNKLKTFAF